jgi:hypothetical protein
MAQQQTMVTVLEAARLVNRSPESVRKVIADRGIKKDWKYVGNVKRNRFKVRLDDVVSVYREIRAAGR